MRRIGEGVEVKEVAHSVGLENNSVSKIIMTCARLCRFLDLRWCSGASRRSRAKNLSPVTLVKDYEYSSWSEYDGEVEPVFRVCDTETVLSRIPYTDLEVWVNAPLPDNAHFLDNDDEKPKLRLSDDQVWQQIIKIAGVTSNSDFQRLDKTKKREAIGLLRGLGASVRQLERLTGISRGIIQLAKS